jgi:cation:H+ antiporter
LVLLKGADWLVHGASALAKKYRLSDLAIGLTIVAFGTSAPELVVNVFASAEGHDDIVLANIIGSNNFNLFIILGIAGLISPLLVHSSTVRTEIPLSLAAALLLFLLANNLLWENEKMISAIDGSILLLLFVLFLAYVYKQLRSEPGDVVKIQSLQLPSIKIWTFILVGLSGLIIGGHLVVTMAIEIATDMGLSEKIIGLTIVAAGTSLPELATSVVAALKKNNDIAVGNIIGSNIFNIFFILGISALVSPISFNPSFNTDIYILAAGTLLLLLAMFTGKRKILDRWEALLFLVAYLGYTFYII